MRCASCHHDVADGAFCVRCGARAGTADSRRRPFAAAPHERTFVPALVSTLFPQLPRARLGVFRLGLGAGTGLVLGLGIAGLYPAAVVAAALVVPTLLVIYLREVNIYEREPVRVLGLTAAWGIASGLLVGLLEARLAPNGVELAVSPSLRTVLVGGVLLPLVAYLSALAGPLVLLPYRRFNDVLDGVTFAVVSAAGFTGAQTLAQSWALFAAGPRPGGRRMPWLAHLFQLAIANPVLVACVSGVVAGTLWIRFRTPVRDRAATRLAARPVRTAVSAAALLVGVACLELMLPRNASVAVAATAAALALLALRRFVHLGLLQEAEEVPVGDDVTCANCGARTPSHTFCRACGVASHALPRAHALRHAGALLLVAGFALGIGSAGAAGAAVLAGTAVRRAARRRRTGGHDALAELAARVRPGVRARLACGDLRPSGADARPRGPRQARDQRSRRLRRASRDRRCLARAAAASAGPRSRQH